MSRLLPLLSFLLALLAALLVVRVVRGGGVGGGPLVIQSVFFVEKSENKNQVHYGIRLDEACAPIGESPVFAYWRMLERGPLATEPLLSREVPAYGLKQQRVTRDERGGRVLATLNAMPARSIAIESAPDEGTCTVRARTIIRGVPAALTSVFVQLKWPFGVDHLVLVGHAIKDGCLVRERISQ